MLVPNLFSKSKKKKDLELLVTLWPTFPFFERFAQDDRLAGIRLNSAMVNGLTLTDELKQAKDLGGNVPLYFDVKGRQLRVKEVMIAPDHLELKLNHPIEVKTPLPVLFKAGADRAYLKHVINGDHLIFEGGPEYMVHEGESLHIRHPSLKVKGELFTDQELEKIAKAQAAGFTHYVLSYVDCQRDVDAFREMIGKDAELILKIESKKGLEYVAKEYKRQEHVSLMAARGDLYVEVNRPHDILAATKFIVDRDPNAMVGSRMLLSVINQSVPECSDFFELGLLRDMGYRRFMLCDGLCLKERSLSCAINAFDNFRKTPLSFTLDDFRKIYT